MSQNLIAGANAPLPNDTISIRIISERPIDNAAYRLASNAKVRGDGDMVFYGQKQSEDGSVRLRGHETDAFFDIDLTRQPTLIEKIAFAFSSDNTLAQIGNVTVEVMQGSTVLLTCRVEGANRNEKAVILGECYRRQGNWKFRFIAQGFDGGLKPLSEHFGVDIAGDQGSNASQTNPKNTNSSNANTANNANRVNTHKPSNVVPPPINNTHPKVNLSKISLTKSQSSINLKKKDNFGKISVNLNWNQRPDSSNQPKKGLLNDLFNKTSQGIDLDVGAMVHLKSGEKTLIQALGGQFGRLQAPPYVHLRADDRTGQVTGGEWLDINGSQWAQIEEVFIFAFIYSGAPNWAQTDGIVTIHVPEQPPIETRMTEGHNAKGMCAIARLVNQNGSINVERINQYFSGHKEMDRAFGWGFTWKRGSK